MKRFLILILAGLVLTGCELQPNRPNIFENPVCKPPCWQNITPGVTTKAEALEILSNSEVVEQRISDLHRPIGRFDNEIGFTMYKGDNLFAGSILILNDRVSLIGFEYKLNITLRRAMELFGAPQSILVVRAGEFDAITLLNPQAGMAFGYRFHMDESSKISPEDEIDYLVFFDPNQYELALDSGFFSYAEMSADIALKSMRPWEGYGSVEQYIAPLAP
jgi:hypothetical protein